MLPGQRNPGRRMTDSQTGAVMAAAHLPICAIGASAGGVMALQDFFSAIDDDLGLSYVVVIHLSPDHPSQLGAILAGRTRMPVEQVEHTLKLRPNCVYVIARGPRTRNRRRQSSGTAHYWSAQQTGAD